MELKNFFAQDDAGYMLSGATCYVYQRGTESLAPGLQKANGNGLISPFEADDQGFIQFAAPNGLYDLRIVKGARDKRIQVQFNDVSDTLAIAESAANRAKGALDSVQLAAGLKDSIEHGLATTAFGQNFVVTSPLGDEFLIVYKNDAGSALQIDEYPNSQVVKDVRDRLSDDPDVLFAIKDDSGFSGLEITQEAIKTDAWELSTDLLRMGAQSFESTDEFALLVVDEFGFVGFQLNNDGTLVSEELQRIEGFTAAEIILANQRALASSAAVLREYNSEVARPIWFYNHFLQYGQSLSTDFEGWPALSKTPRLGNMMLGNSVRPASRADASFTPLGVTTLTPMKSVVQDSGTGGTILTDAQVAALAPGASNEGEASVVGMTNYAKLLHNQRLQTANDESRVFVASSCGVNGQTIEQLTKGNATNRWLRLTQAAEKVKAIAVGEGKTYGVVGVSFLQGEFNYSSNWAGVDTLIGYKEKMAAMYNDIETDIVSTTAGQTQPPLFMTYQTGASYTNDANNLAIGMAQFELSEERRNWVLATPVYQLPDKGGHLTANSYRWLGKQFAKVWHRVVELGQDWKPLSPLSAVTRDREALITFHVPHPPLVFDKPYVGRTATDYVTKGFTALDSTGSLGIATVSIAADCVIMLTFSRDPVGQVSIRYADKTNHNGNGCLRDCDSSVSDDLYEYSAGTGQYADENIPALVGKPYPLHNWCIAFHISAVGAA